MGWKTSALPAKRPEARRTTPRRHCCGHAAAGSLPLRSAPPPRPAAPRSARPRPGRRAQPAPGGPRRAGAPSREALLSLPLADGAAGRAGGGGAARRPGLGPRRGGAVAAAPSRGQQRHEPPPTGSGARLPPVFRFSTRCRPARRGRDGRGAGRRADETVAHHGNVGEAGARTKGRRGAARGRGLRGMGGGGGDPLCASRPSTDEGGSDAAGAGRLGRPWQRGGGRRCAARRPRARRPPHRIPSRGGGSLCSAASGPAPAFVRRPPGSCLAPAAGVPGGGVPLRVLRGRAGRHPGGARAWGARGGGWSAGTWAPSFQDRWRGEADICCLTSCATEKYMWFPSCNFPSLQMTQGLDFVNESLCPCFDILLGGPFQKGVAQQRLFGA